MRCHEVGAELHLRLQVSAREPTEVEMASKIVLISRLADTSTHGGRRSGSTMPFCVAYNVSPARERISAGFDSKDPFDPNPAT